MRWLALPALSLLLFGYGALAQVAVPPLRAPVTDLTGTLTPEQVATLERRLQELETKKGSQIAVLLVPTTQPETIDQYSIRVAEAWKLGRRGVNDGALLLVAKDDRAVRIEVGYGLEGVVPDVLADRIVEQVVVPRFRSGDFFGGLTEGVTRMIALIEGEPLPEPARTQRTRGNDGLGSVLPLLLLVVFVGSSMLRRMLGTFGGASATAGIAAAIVWFLTSTLVIAIGAAVIAFVIALVGGGGGGGWTNPRRRGSGGFGGGWGGGWSSGGGGGGWSGGGGGFGGGGASGRW